MAPGATSGGPSVVVRLVDEVGPEGHALRNGVSLQVHAGRRLSLVSGPRAAAPGRLWRHRSLVRHEHRHPRPQDGGVGARREPGASPRRAGCLGHRDVPLGHRDERDRLRQEPGSTARSRIRRFRAIAPRVLPGGARGRSRAGRRRLPAVRRTGSRFPGGVPRRLAGRYGPLVVRQGQDRAGDGRPAPIDGGRVRRRDRAAREGRSAAGRRPAEGRVPRDARSRVAQSAGADHLLSCRTRASDAGS